MTNLEIHDTLVALATGRQTPRCNYQGCEAVCWGGNRFCPIHHWEMYGRLPKEGVL